MENKLGLGKSYRIIRNINCCIYGFGAFYSAIDTMRLINGLASNPFSPIAFLALSMSLSGIYMLEEKQKRYGMVMIVVGGLIGGWGIAADPLHPGDALLSIIVFGGLAISQALSFNWKEFFNRKNKNNSYPKYKNYKNEKIK